MIMHIDLYGQDLLTKNCCLRGFLSEIQKELSQITSIVLRMVIVITSYCGDHCIGYTWGCRFACLCNQALLLNSSKSTRGSRQDSIMVSIDSSPYFCLQALTTV